MSRSTKTIIAMAAMLAATACADLTSSSEDSIELGPAFQTVPVGFSASSNSFDESGDVGLPFLPEDLSIVGFHDGGRGGGSDRRGKHRGNDGFGKGGLRGLLMGGGLGPDFIGGIGFGKGRGRGPFGAFRLPASCTFSEATGRVTCPESAKHGLTVNMSFAFKDADGDAQPAFDTVTTDLVNVQTEVSGTKTRRGGEATSTLSHSSDRTVTGLAQGSTKRTVNGTAAALETATGSRDGVAFTAEREAFDTTSNLAIPITDGRPTIPESGTVIRRMRVAITPEGGIETTRTRREKITFDGTNVIQVEITQDDVTKNCTITLPAPRLVCD